MATSSRKVLMDPEKNDKRWRTWVMILLTVIVAVLAYGVALLNQSIDDTRASVTRAAEAAKIAADISDQNNRFVDNFSNYMTCLIVNEEEVVVAVGEDVYVELCKQLLYRGIDEIPPTIKVQIPTNFPSTTTTTTP